MFSILVIGGNGSGKSMLINALLNESIAPTNIKTSFVTKFRFDCSDSILISFSDGRDPIWKTFRDRDDLKDELERLMSSQEKIKEIEVGLKEFALPIGTVLIDTTEIIRRKHIEESNMILFCMRNIDVSYANNIFQQLNVPSEKIYLIATQSDTHNFSESEKDWLDMFNRGNLDFQRQHVIPISAYFYALLDAWSLGEIDRNSESEKALHRIAKHFGIEKISENFDILLEKTGIPKLRSLIACKSIFKN